VAIFQAVGLRVFGCPPGEKRFLKHGLLLQLLPKRSYIGHRPRFCALRVDDAKMKMDKPDQSEQGNRAIPELSKEDVEPQSAVNVQR
jgi:hypothetical protein